MIIVAGWLRVDPSDRDGYLEGSQSVVRHARAASGCLDFALSPDLVDPARINVYERWESVDAVEVFRGEGPVGERLAAIVEAQVQQYEVGAAAELL